MFAHARPYCGRIRKSYEQSDYLPIFRRENPESNFRVDNQREFQGFILCPLESLIILGMRSPGTF